MEKKAECKVVQDLLFGYVDETLNVESKELVEKHLMECEKCKEYLNQIKEDINQNESSQKREIDYLKKVRIKSKLKSVIIAIVIIIFCVFAFYLNKFLKINSIMKNADKSLETQNFYCEKQEILSKGRVAVTKLYYRDSKYKKVSEMYSEDGVETRIITYGEKDSDEIIEINENERRVSIIKGDIEKIFNKEENIKWNRFQKSERNSIIANLGKTFMMSLETDTYDVGKEYYIMRNKYENTQRWEVWIDKETGLVIKEIERDAEKLFIPGTDIVNEINDRITTYSYDFNTVTEDDVKKPDYSNYNIENLSNNFSDYTD